MGGDFEKLEVQMFKDFITAFDYGVLPFSYEKLSENEEPQSGLVVKLVGKNHDSSVEKKIFVLYYAEMCKYSQDLMPIWE